MTTPTRQLFDVALRPVQGSRFAPTGFADLGAATFDRPSEDGWTRCLLVESAQSMANRLEGTLWDTGSGRPVDPIASLPYVEVQHEDGRRLTSSREESHRLASPYIRNATIGGILGSEWLVEKLGLVPDAPLDLRAIARAVFSIDPLCLLHGVFFAGKGGSEFPGQPKFTRIITGFIEAEDVRAAESGGVKRDHVNHTQVSSGGDSTEGYGSIPFHRTEWTARSITASFNLDLAQLRSYGLPEPAEQLVAALGRLEISLLLNGPLRLRSNCDLERVDNSPLHDRNGVALPAPDAALAEAARLIEECERESFFGQVQVATWAPKSKKSKS